MEAEAPPAADSLADPEILALVRRFVARRTAPRETDDLVQAILCEALAAPGRPRERERLRRWLVGLARHKLADLRRAPRREVLSAEPPEQEAPEPAVEARSLATWAQAQVGGADDGARTLEWLAREAEGEKLEAIAEAEALPAERVRQRVSRLRRLLRHRWQLELAAAVTLLGVLVALWRPWRRPRLVEARPWPHAMVPAPVPPPPREAPREPEAPPVPTPLELARKQRDEALPKCDGFAWRECLEGLDRAKRLDPAGDRTDEVKKARLRAGQWAARQRWLERTSIGPGP